MWRMVLTLVYKAWEGHKLMYEYVLLFTALEGLLARISSHGRLIACFQLSTTWNMSCVTGFLIR